MQDLDASRAAKASADAWDDHQGSATQRPTAEDADAAEEHRLSVLMAKVRAATRRAKIPDLERELRTLQNAEANEYERSQHDADEEGDTPDSYSFPQYRNPVDSGFRSSVYGGKTSPPIRQTEKPAAKPMDVSRVVLDGIKRSNADSIRMSLFNFANLLETVGLKELCSGLDHPSTEESRLLKSIVLKWVKGTKLMKRSTCTS